MFGHALCIHRRKAKLLSLFHFPVPSPAQWVQITGLFQFMFRFPVAVIQGEGDFSVRVRIFASHVTGKEHLNFCLLLKLLSPVKQVK